MNATKLRINKKVPLVAKNGEGDADKECTGRLDRQQEIDRGAGLGLRRARYSTARRRR